MSRSRSVATEMGSEQRWQKGKGISGFERQNVGEKRERGEKGLDSQARSSSPWMIKTGAVIFSRSERMMTVRFKTPSRPR